MSINESDCLPLSLIRSIQQPSVTYVCSMALLFVLGVLGNGSIIWLFFRELKLRDANNAFIINLAICDFFFTIVFIPSIIFEDYYYLRPFGKTFCIVLTLSTYCCHDVSILSLTALCYLRHRAVMHPMDHYTKHRHILVKTGCIAIWSFSIVAAIVPATNCHVDLICDIWFYVHRIQSTPATEIYQLVRFGALFILPLSIMAYLYIVMAIKLFRVEHTLYRNNSTSARKAVQSRKRLGIIVSILVLLFAICWIPRYVQHLSTITVLGMKLIPGTIPAYLGRLSNAMMAVASSANPIILYAASSMFRMYFMRHFCCRSSNVFLRISGSSTMTSLKRFPRFGNETTTKTWTPPSNSPDIELNKMPPA